MKRYARSQRFIGCAYPNLLLFILFRFDCAAGVEPRIEAAFQRIRPLEIMLAEHLRHTGA